MHANPNRHAMLFVVLLALASCLAAGCKHNPSADTDDRSEPVETSAMGGEEMSDASEKPRMLERADQIEANLGKRVEVTGKAENAKLSALVMASDFSLYCLDISGWEEDVRGKKVTVTGKLERTDQFQARVDENGAISQGTEGSDLVLRGCRRVE